MEFDLEQENHIYTYSCTEEEVSLCRLEMRSFFGYDSKTNVLESSLGIDPSRSPFMKARITVIYEGNTFEDILSQISELKLQETTFKVVFVKNPDVQKNEKVSFKDRRLMERNVGEHIQGYADLQNPERLFGVMEVNGRWVFGTYTESESIWFHHQKKPRSYSTSLGTRVARAVVNIAIPNPIGIKAIDPCCGIGTVLIEAYSMGIHIDGSDMNPLTIDGARENIIHFGFNKEIEVKDIRKIVGDYDVAIIDMPYNICSIISPKEQLQMLQSARRIAKKLVVVTIDPIDSILENADFIIQDRCDVKKGYTFTREVIVCE